MRFRFRPGLFVATLCALAILIWLGVWQLHRLSWKRALIAQTTERLSAPPIPFDEAVRRAEAGEHMEYQPVFLEGEFVNRLEAHVFGTYDAKPGAYIFTPFKYGGGLYAYIDRGFAPQKFVDAATRLNSELDGAVRVEGLFRSTERPIGPAKWVLPRDQPEDNLYFLRDPEILARISGLKVPPYYIDSYGKESASPWPKGGTTALDFPNRHFEYALTWFGLAFALVSVYVAFSIDRD